MFLGQMQMSALSLGQQPFISGDEKGTIKSDGSRGSVHFLPGPPHPYVLQSWLDQLP